jgi:septal ring factor EnvC (AmiA/AmiB activator)
VRRRQRSFIAVGVVLSVVCGMIAPTRTARAQDAAASNNPDELKKSLADALNQLKAAQDRKNELATENEKLKQKLAEQDAQMAELRRQTTEFAAKTWQFRSQLAAWEAFLQRYPNLLNRWKVFLASDPLSAPTTMPDFEDVTAPTPQSPTISASE